jgi:hypothetical protein
LIVGWLNWFEYALFNFRLTPSASNEFHSQVELASFLNSNLEPAHFHIFFPRPSEAADETSDAGLGFQVMGRCLSLSGFSSRSYRAQLPSLSMRQHPALKMHSFF